MKILVDMNLSPEWVPVFSSHGVEATHWSDVGDPRAPDSEIMDWAREHGFVIFTHDLDFSALLAMTRSMGPSVIQVRTQDVLPSAIGELVLSILQEHALALTAGAIVSVDERASRVRILPIKG